MLAVFCPLRAGIFIVLGRFFLAFGRFEDGLVVLGRLDHRIAGSTQLVFASESESHLFGISGQNSARVYRLPAFLRIPDGRENDR